MGLYSVPTTATMSTTKTLGSLYTVTGTGVLRRNRTIDLVLGCDGTPGDTAVRFQFQRFTAHGTNGSLAAIVSLDPADVAPGAAAGQAQSAEPTYTASTVFMQLVFNQRSTIRWFAAPGEEIVVPATADNGWGALPAVSPALSGYMQIMFQE